MEIEFTTQTFKEGRMFVAYTRELDLSSCGGTESKALRNLKEAVRLFLEEAGKMGTRDQILEEAAFSRRKSGFTAPKLITTQRVSLPLPLEHAQA
jgi:predicted RNase H-like HicB family nuclease